AIAGKAEEGGWPGAASTAGDAGQAFWLGRAAKSSGGGLYAVDAQTSSSGRITLVAAADLARVVEPQAGQAASLGLILATPDGAVVAASGANGSGQLGSLKQAMGVA